MRYLFLAIFLMMSMVMIQCDQKSERPALGSPDKIQKRLPAVCIVDEASLRDGPSANANWKTAIALGEKLHWLGISKQDSIKESREYFKVELSDSTVGWTTSYAVELNAEPAVIIERALLYRRPDLKTMTDKDLQPMEFVAILETNSDWLRVLGENRKKRGWIERSAASLREDDIAVGVLASKALKENNSEKRHQRIMDIIENPAFANSGFIDELMQILNSDNDE
ncbi:hypothetical protein EH223_19510 [candidate division KSB1 bacterium]|nr:hypothetical protein [candidate division KSB1 bacterium]RQW00134.1 MAG: hypothetical protein EH223_19510 [candidate division KSB1 bacterium]